MTNHEKAEQILYALMRICPSRNVVLLQPDDILSRCSSDEIDFFYKCLCCGGTKYGSKA